MPFACGQHKLTPGVAPHRGLLAQKRESVGDPLGDRDGSHVGLSLGLVLGLVDGDALGLTLGLALGEADGASVGAGAGFAVGAPSTHGQMRFQYVAPPKSFGASSQRSAAAPAWYAKKHWPVAPSPRIDGLNAARERSEASVHSAAVCAAALSALPPVSSAHSASLPRGHP